MIKANVTGSFKNSDKFLKKIQNLHYRGVLDIYGQKGVDLLREYTPKDTGLLADSWYYEIVATRESLSLLFLNKDIEHGLPIAILVQYGHATRDGSYYEGVDYINPALKPLFDALSIELWKEVVGY